MMMRGRLSGGDLRMSGVALFPINSFGYRFVWILIPLISSGWTKYMSLLIIHSPGSLNYLYLKGRKSTPSSDERNEMSQCFFCLHHQTVVVSNLADNSLIIY